MPRRVSDKSKFLLGTTSNAMSRNIFEISPLDGSVIQEFTLPGNTIADGVVCIHQGDFVSFRFGGEGVLIPLLGSPER